MGDCATKHCKREMDEEWEVVWLNIEKKEMDEGWGIMSLNFETMELL